jgi:hypothetical protein
MAGAAEPYDHLPFFYSDLFDVGSEIRLRSLPMSPKKVKAALDVLAKK